MIIMIIMMMKMMIMMIMKMMILGGKLKRLDEHRVNTKQVDEYDDLDDGRYDDLDDEK